MKIHYNVLFGLIGALLAAHLLADANHFGIAVTAQEKVDLPIALGVFLAHAWTWIYAFLQWKWPQIFKIQEK